MSENDRNAYELLDVKIEATEQEVRTAYRQRSRKVHPDRNPNDPEAARKFHELNQAYELLLDPLRRLALDAKLRVQKAKAERFKDYDEKRKRLVEELEEGERAFKKAKIDKQKEEVARWQETEKIKDEGRRLREVREKAALEREKEMTAENSADAEEEPHLESTDTTVRVKYNLSSHPSLTTSQALSNLFAQFGPTDTDHIAVLLKPPKKNPTKPPKHGSALIPFKKIGDAFAAVCASDREERGLKGVEVSWVGGKEPQILVWLKRKGMIGVQVPKDKEGNEDSSTSFSSFPSTFSDAPAVPNIAPSTGVDYESLTLMRLRQAERERLEKEIMEQEANES